MSNIRSHKHIIFEPSATGVTAISGANGAGKSTLVDSITWTLFGTKPHGVARVASIIREGAEVGKDKVYARVELRLDHSNLKVERRIVTKNGAVECDVWEKKDGESGFTHIAGPAVSHSEPHIRKLLKMDESGFLAAVLVQQKQVDHLISASPKERAEVVEKLTGISSITAALTESRQQYNSLRKVLQHSNYDEKELEALKKEKETLIQNLEKKTEERDKLQSKFDDLEATVKDLSEKVKVEEEREEEVTLLNEKIITLKVTIDSREKELARLGSEKDAKKNQLSALSTGSDVKVLSSQLTSKKNELRNKQRVSDQADAQIKQLGSQVKRFEEVISKSSVKELTPAQEGLLTFEKRVLALNHKLKKLDSEKSELSGGIKKVDNAIKVISSSHGSCPTCLQEVSNPTSAIESLNGERLRFEQRIDEIGKERSTHSKNLSTAEEGVGKFKEVISSLTELTEIKSKIESLKNDKNNADALIVTLESEVTGLEKLYNNSKRNAEVKEEYDKLLESAVKVSDEIEKLSKTLNETEEKLKKLGQKKGGSLANLRTKLSSSSEQRNDSLLKLSQVKEDVSVMKAKEDFLKEKILKSEEETERYEDLLKNVEVAASSTEIIEEFREERIRTSVPIVGVYASDLLTRFTEGTFNQFKLDEKFNASVVLSSGVERPVGLLSGGESSAAAISLRLAISMLLNSNMIILDEVLVSQDRDRSEQILTTIKEVCRGQVVMISHGPNTAEIADKVVEL